MRRALAIVWALALAAGALAAQSAPERKLALREQARFSAADVLLMRVHFSPANDRLLTASAGGEAALWTLDGRRLGHFSGQRPPMFNAGFSPGGGTLATTGYDGTVRLWTLPAGAPRVLQLITAAITDVAFCGAEDRIAVSSDAGVARLLRLGPGAPQPLAEVRGPGTARRVACCPKVQLFATAFDSGEVQVLGFTGRVPLRFESGQDRMNAIAFTDDGRQLLTGSTDGSVRMWTVSGELLLTMQVANSGWVNDARFSPDGQTIAIATDDGHVRLYAPSGALLLDQQVTKVRATTVTFDGTGNRLAAGTSTGEVVVYEVAHE